MAEQLSLRGTLEGHTGWVTSIATPTEDNSMLLSASRDKTVMVWDIIGGPMEEDYAKARQDLRETRSNLHKANLELIQKNRQISELQKRAREGDAENKKLTKSIEPIRTTYNSTAKDLNALKKTAQEAGMQTNKELKDTVAELVVSERAAKRSRAEMESSVGDLRKGMTEATEKVAALEAKNKKLKAALEAATA